MPPSVVLLPFENIMPSSNSVMPQTEGILPPYKIRIHIIKIPKLFDVYMTLGFLSQLDIAGVEVTRYHLPATAGKLTSSEWHAGSAAAIPGPSPQNDAVAT